MSLPPGVSASTFADGLAQMRSAVGDEWVFTNEEDVGLYRDFYSVLWDEPEERVASAAVAPANVEEVQAVVRAANERGIPIYPISTGRNLGYGGSAPVYSGSVVLDLKRMNRILDVNEGNASCLVEPGVSYFDMYRHLQETGSKLWLDVPDPGWGSMVGNALDSGGGYTAAPYRGHFEAQCGIEAVLADGELFRTGMGAMPGSETWQQYRMGIGPCLDGLFRQSSLGVVTKMGFWLFPQPEAFLSGSVDLPRFADVGPLVDLFNELEYGNIFNGMPSISSPVLSRENPMMFQQIPEEDEMNRLAQETGLPAWSGSASFYGPEKVIRAQWEYVKERFAHFEGVKFRENQFVKLPLSAEDMKKVSKARFGIPSLEIFSVGSRGFGDFNPSDGHIWFSAVIPRTGEGLVKANRVMRSACKRLDMPLFMFSPAVTCWTRSFVLFAAVPVYKDAESNKALREKVLEVIRICADHGWGEYRCPPAFQDAVMDSYSFNNNILRRVNERIKDALDPNGIISAGRYGVWPKHLREGRA
ncbi:4-cresol dehydrogenase (hydroxylating) [Altererythrobacter atlanticus]|uniref:4-cresol dehydrogenase [hydroxylating] flavoprotein subunit n=1 Tax=Croceibacterium atlanticum TaxID=1267766 RepID=A0A0F7KUU9_9SPHN|nr:FAD-binding oxidoreductase [Croceibacterium atlanticum]AKH44138.1 4-cresol dehydrogenase [hydroxylating] flavoprotein subunit [Croceibacterium atlanticum]MBB5732448.1 4-cresol dehydrogenase (hydroxylating) [Croceibacterium atlanticum]